MNRILSILLVLLHSSLLGWATNYYVDNSLTASANTGLSWSAAWTNFASIHWEYNFDATPRVSDNDTLYISGGASSQVYTDEFVLVGAPTVGQAITATPGIDAGHTGTVIFDGGGDAHNGDVNWNGFCVAVNGAGIFDGGSHSNFVIRNVYNPSNKNFTHGMVGSPNFDLVENFIITNCGNGIHWNVGGHNEVKNFYIGDIRGDHCFDCGSGAQEYGDTKVHNGIVRSDTTPDIGNGPDGGTAENSTDIYNITFWNDPNSRQFNGQHPDAIQGGGNFVRIFNNTFHNWTGASHSSDPVPPSIHDIVYANNIFVYDDTNFIVGTILSSGDGSIGFGQITSISNIYWLNNTLADFGATFSPGGGIGYEWDKDKIAQPFVSNFVVENNIVLHVGDTASATNGYWLGFGTYLDANFNINADITLDHNLTVRDPVIGGSFAINTGGRGATYRLQSPLLTNAPAFVAYTYLSPTSDFHLATGDTAAHGQGANLTTLFTSLGLPLTDRDGNARPSTGAWDIGAYQGTTVGGHASPSPPASFTTFFGKLSVQVYKQ